MSSKKIDRIRKLITDLDYYKFISFNENKIQEIEKELNNLRSTFSYEDFNITSMDLPETDHYVPYPDLTDPIFHNKLFFKREFNKSLYEPIDTKKTHEEHSIEKCSRTGFQLSKNQVFLKHFMHPSTPYNGILLFHGVGVGKCHAINTPILMFDGSVKMVQDIMVGDLVMGDNSSSREVLSLHRGRDQLYTVHPIKGDPFIVNSEHILCLKYSGKGAIEKVTRKCKTYYKAVHLDNSSMTLKSRTFTKKQDAEDFLQTFTSEDKILEVSVKDYIGLSSRLKKNIKAYRVSVEFPLIDVPSCPYAFGTWLMGHDADETIKPLFALYPTITKNKHIPRVFLCNHSSIRSELLAAILDKEAYLIHNCYKLIVKNERLANDILFLCRSLGLAAYKKSLTSTTKCQICFRIHISGKGLDLLPLRYKEKKTHLRQQIKDVLVTGITIKEHTYDDYYGFTVDQNNRYLLGDFTVCHNSCSAISIAEQFHDIFKKKVLVLMPTNLRENFIKQIFDVSKVNKELNQSHQCTGMKYLMQVPNRKLLDTKDLLKQIKANIYSRYEFKGFTEFANEIKNKKESQLSQARFVSKIREEYSKRVIIIDEVHNVRQGKNEESKMVPPRLMEVLKYAEHVKLVLLTATPMFNEASEIIWLLNLLLANDKRPLIQERDIFDQNKILTQAGRKILENACRGYVSYMRGENPFAFPFKLYPSINNDKKILKKVPKEDIKGRKIPNQLRLQKLELIQSKMSDYQTQVYDIAESNIMHLDNELVEDDVDENIVTKTNTNTDLVQISNIVYPYESWQSDYKQCIGKKGIDNVFDKVKTTGINSYKLQYKKSVLKKYGEILDETSISKYSPKIRTIIKYIKKSKGIVFVYSFYKEAGVIPLAIALEHAGFKKYNNNNILQNASPHSPFMINGKQAYYSILTPNKNLTPNFEGEIDQIRNEKNKDGEIIKVVIGTSVVAEGIDFKFIREVHLLEPWYHLNKVAQIIGRAIRTCSHISMTPGQRNVTIFHHVNTLKRSKETIDLRIYRIAENKQTTIDDIETLLKENAVDCAFNQNVLYFDPSYLNMSIDLETSQGTVIQNFQIGDHPNSGFTNITCRLNPKNKDGKIDDSTFNKSFYVDEMDMYSQMISLLYKESHYYTLDEIIQKLEEKHNLIDPDVLKYTLEYMLNTKRIIFNKDDIEGYLIYRSNKYYFQPADNNDNRIPNFMRRHYKTLVQSRLKIDKELTKERHSLSENEDDPFNEVQTLVQQLIKNANILKGNKFTSFFYDYVIDRLSRDKLMTLGLRMMGNSIVNIKDANIKEIARSLEEGHVLVKEGDSYKYFRDVFTNDDNTQGKHNIYVKRDEKLKKASPNELVTFRMNPNSKVSVLSLKDLKGFVEISDSHGKDIARFKIIDSDKEKSQGSTCERTSSLKNEMLTTLINGIQNEIQITKKTSKASLCLIYEIILRAMSNPPLFARPFVIKLMKSKRKTEKL